MTKGTKADGEKMVDRDRCLGESHVQAVKRVLVASRKGLSRSSRGDKLGWLEGVNVSVEVEISSTGGQLDYTACEIPSSPVSLCCVRSHERGIWWKK